MCDVVSKWQEEMAKMLSIKSQRVAQAEVEAVLRATRRRIALNLKQMENALRNSGRW